MFTIELPKRQNVCNLLHINMNNIIILNEKKKMHKFVNQFIPLIEFDFDYHKMVKWAQVIK